jgi:glycosyltransferase involved in cell wall biosynthesis
MLLNNRFLGRITSSRGLEFVVSSRVQEAEILAMHPHARVHRIPNSVPAGAPVARKPRAPGTPLRIGYLGHTYLIKGVRELVAALDLLANRGTHVSATFALSDLGARNLLAELQRGGHQCLARVDTTRFYADLDLLVLPYWVEWGTNVFPNVLLESLHQGVPVITRDLPLTRELFGAEAPLAVLTPGSDPVTLATTLEAVIAGRITLPSPEMLQAAFNDTFDPERISEQWKVLLTTQPAPA